MRPPPVSEQLTGTDRNMPGKPSLNNPAGGGLHKRMVRPTGPRLRCEERSNNHFYGRYKGHSVAVERDHPGQRWGFRLITKEGMRAADGVRDGDETMREVILYALTGSELWPNK